MRAGRNFISRFGAFEVDSDLHAFSSRTLIPTLYPNVFNLVIEEMNIRTLGEKRGDYLRSRSLIPLTLFWVYWTTSEKR